MTDDSEGGNEENQEITFSRIIEVSSRVKQAVRKELERDSFYGKFRKGNLLKFYQWWSKHRVLEREFDWKVKKEYFFEENEEDSWEKYIQQLERLFIDISEDRSSFVIYGERREKLEFLFNNLMQYDSRDITNRQQEMDVESDEVEGFSVSNGIYTPTTTMYDATYFHTLINKISPEVPKFELSNFVSRSNYSTAHNQLMRTKIRIIRGIKLIENIRFYGKYEYICPLCGVSIPMKPYQMTNKKIKHMRCTRNNGKDVEISKSGYKNSDFLDLFCYEVMTYDMDDNVSPEPKYFFSFDSGLENGLYIADIVNILGGVTSPEDRDMKTLMLGVSRITPKILPGLFDKEKGMKIAGQYGVPHHRLYDLQGAVIDFYKGRGIHLKPKKGGLAQLMLLSSAAMKVLFKYDKFAISIIGDTSLSKTYPARLICPLMDQHYEFVSRGEAASIVGLQGGVNMNFYLGNKKLAMFQEGIMTRGGLTVFDESGVWYENPQFNNILKSFFDDSITIQKMGGKTVPQKYTPILLSNFLRFHSNVDEKVKSYVIEVKSFYYRSLSQSDENNLPHGKGRQESDKYVSSQNLFLPLQFYDNVYLRKAVGLIRKKYFQMDVDWKTGGSIPAANRILFDVICKKDVSTEFENSFEDVVDSESQNQYDLPTADFIMSCIDYYLGELDINIKRIDANPPEIRKQLKTLMKNIEKYLESEDGKPIVVHFRDGNIRVDEKLAGLIAKYYLGMQLLNNPKATELDEATKVTVGLILFKNKRGVTEAEYNFIDHSYFPDAAIIEDVNIDDYVNVVNKSFEEKLKQEGKMEAMKELGLNPKIDLEDEKDG